MRGNRKVRGAAGLRSVRATAVPSGRLQRAALALLCTCTGLSSGVSGQKTLHTESPTLRPTNPTTAPTSAAPTPTPLPLITLLSTTTGGSGPSCSVVPNGTQGRVCVGTTAQYENNERCSFSVAADVLVTRVRFSTSAAGNCTADFLTTIQRQPRRTNVYCGAAQTPFSVLPPPTFTLDASTDILWTTDGQEAGLAGWTLCAEPLVPTAVPTPPQPTSSPTSSAPTDAPSSAAPSLPPPSAFPTASSAPTSAAPTLAAPSTDAPSAAPSTETPTGVPTTGAPSNLPTSISPSLHPTPSPTATPSGGAVATASPTVSLTDAAGGESGGGAALVPIVVAVVVAIVLITAVLTVRCRRRPALPESKASADNGTMILGPAARGFKNPTPVGGQGSAAPGVGRSGSRRRSQEELEYDLPDARQAHPQQQNVYEQPVLTSAAHPAPGVALTDDLYVMTPQGKAAGSGDVEGGGAIYADPTPAKGRVGPMAKIELTEDHYVA